MGGAPWSRPNRQGLHLYPSKVTFRFSRIRSVWRTLMGHSRQYMLELMYHGDLVKAGVLM